ncbi:hypothetical protein BC830DRAFT_1146604 [Chytriomyces sp. MP71]|nr:hypothetical protein BC830DRAFT_1146604 [Chytriomyces sp. MP71]
MGSRVLAPPRYKRPQQQFNLNNNNRYVRKIGTRKDAIKDPNFPRKVPAPSDGESILDASGTAWPNDKLKNDTSLLLVPWKPRTDFSNTPRVVYLNGHRGCTENFHAVLRRLHLNFRVVDPRRIVHYGMRDVDAAALISRGWVRSLCVEADVIVAADTAPDARAVLRSLLNADPAMRCGSKIVMELTNRYDWMVGDREVYHRMLRELLGHKQVRWTANNPFEGEFMRARVGVDFNVTLLRALGVWGADETGERYKTNETLTSVGQFTEVVHPSNQTRYPRVRWDTLARIKDLQKINRPKVGEVLDYHCLPIATLPKEYGGPAALLKFKAFLDFPYQVSVMKFYENVAHGVPQLLPTPRLLRALIKSKNHHYMSTWLDKLEEVQLFLDDPTAYAASYKDGKQNAVTAAVKMAVFDYGHYVANWKELCDFYRKEFEPFAYYFDSLSELGSYANRPWDEFDTKKVRTEGPKFYAEVRKQSMNAWVDIFHGFGFMNVQDHSKILV